MSMLDSLEDWTRYDAQPTTTESSSDVQTIRTGGKPMIPGSLNTTTGWNATTTARPKNDTCGGCTVNAQAALDWWFSRPVSSTLGAILTLNSSNSTYYSISMVRTVAISDQMLADGVTSYLTKSFNSILNATYDDYVFTTPPLPVAAATVTMTQYNAFSGPNGTFDRTERNALYPANTSTPSIAIPAVTGGAFIARWSTNVVYYTAYEVEYPSSWTGVAGKVQCVTRTSTYQLPTPFPYQYRDTAGALGQQVPVNGTVLDGFISRIPQSTCIAGTWNAPQPTMFIYELVDYKFGMVPLAGYKEITVTDGLSAPSSTDFGPRSSPISTSAPGPEQPDGGISHSGSSGSAGSTAMKGPGLGADIAGIVLSGIGDASDRIYDLNTGAVITSITSRLVGAANGNTNENSNKHSSLDSKGGSNGGPNGQPGSSAGFQVNGIGFAAANPPGRLLGAPAAAPQEVQIGDTKVPIQGTPDGGAVVGGITIAPGKTAPVNGIPVAVAAQGGVIVVSGSETVGYTVPTPIPPPVIAIDGGSFTANAATQYFVAPGQTLTPGGTASVNGHAVSLAPDAQFLVVGGHTEGLSPADVTVLPPLNIDGTVITADAGNAYTVGGQTLTPGGQITVSGNTISLGPSASYLAINGQTITAPARFPAVNAQPPLTVDGLTYYPQSGGPSYVIAGQTLTPGGAVTANGNTISLGAGGSSTLLIINGVSTSLTSVLVSPAMNVGGTLFTELPGGSFVIDGQVLEPGSQIEVLGTTLSFQLQGSFVVVNGATTSLVPTSAPAIIIGGMTYSATYGVSGGYIVDGQSLVPGGSPITASGTVISLIPGATALVLNGQTTYLNGNGGSTTNLPLLTIGGSVYTAKSGTAFVINGQTLTPGGVITVSGTTISLSPMATALVVDGKTTTIFPATNTLSASGAVSTSITSAAPSSTPSSPSAFSTSKSKSVAALPGKHVDSTLLRAILVLLIASALLGRP